MMVWSRLIFVPGIQILSVFFLSFFFFFPTLWFVNFVKTFHLLSIFFSNSQCFKNQFSQFLQILFVTTVRKFTKKNHSSVQNLFCFSTPDLFVMTIHVIFPTCTYNGLYKLWDFHRGSSVGQDNLTKANWPPHWHHGNNFRAHLNLVINILNIKNNIVSLDKISVPKSKSIIFGA
jgi:hypothetical protein